MRNPPGMPWQDKIAEASERIDRAGGVGFTQKSAGESARQRKEIFASAQIPGTIAMCEGGGFAKPVAILIETQNGWLVRVTLSLAETRAFAELLLASCGGK